MKPLTLRLQGFKSYESSTEISFEDRTLFAIVGPVGSGKSSILDGIAYALYGKTPGTERDTKGLICSRVESAEVELVFEVDERSYTVSRGIRRKGNAVHALTDDAGDKITGAREVTERISELVGLDFKAFCSSVLLPQGRFADFLTATPTERMRILKGVFRLEKLDLMREHAKEQQRDLEVRLGALEISLAQIPPDATESLEALQNQAAELMKAATLLEEARPRVQALQERSLRTETELERSRSRLNELERLSKELPHEDEVADVLMAQTSAEAPLKDAEAVRSLALDAVKEAESLLEAVQKKTGTERELEQLRGLLRQHHEAVQQVSALEEETLRLEQEQGVAETELQTVEETERIARHTWEIVSNRRAEAEAMHSAHALREHLVAGEACPVCEQQILAVPKAGRLPALEEARLAEAEAGAALEKARVRREEAKAFLEKIKTRLEPVRARTADLRSSREQMSLSLQARLDLDGDPSAELDARDRQLADATRSLTAARISLDEATAATEGLRAAALEAARTMQKLVQRMSHCAGSLGLEPEEELDGADAVARFSTMLRRELAETAVRAREEAESTSLEAAAITTERSALEEEIGTSVDDIDDRWRELSRAAADAEAHADKLRRDLAAAEEMRKESGHLVRRRDVYKELSEDLRDARFVNFVLEDKRRLLCALGSEKLFELTSRYRFDDSGDFQIVDSFDGDKKRGVDSLSGGETFLAALALALGLADAVAREGGRLQCFFLDEGFGSLDPEALDLALDGIERVVSRDRLIGLVSHVPAMSERIEDKIVLDRSDAGLSVLKEGASLV